MMQHHSLEACRLDKGVMGLFLFPLGHQCCFKSLETSTHFEPVEEFICRALVLHKQLQVLEHLKEEERKALVRDKSKLFPDTSLTSISVLIQIVPDSDS